MAAQILKKLGYATAIAALALVGAATTSPAQADAQTASASACSSTSGKAKRARGTSRSVSQARRLRRKCSSGSGSGSGSSPSGTSSSGSGSTGSGGSSSGSTPPPPGTLLRQDPTTSPDPMPLWNAIDAASPSRHQQFSSGGPSGGAFRRMSVQDGDNFWGERAELGYNSRLNGLGAPWGTFFLYNAGDRRVTDFWMRLPTSFPIDTPKWQVVMQMKQTGPHANNGGTPVLALEAREGRWVLTQSDSAGYAPATHEVWSTPATLGQWTHVSLDVTYSPDPSQGRVQLTVGEESSPTFTTFTQKYEMAPGSQGLNPGDPIPSHLRMGMYHDPSLPGTHVDFADVRVSA
jgi:polysaccharide lyase-like protein